MFQCGKGLADFRLAGPIQIGEHYARSTGQAREDAAPVVDDHGVAIGFAAVGMEAGLGRSDDVTEIFDGSDT